MFEAYPTYSRYRTLTLRDPMQRGEDVYALQKAINGVLGAHTLATDGVLGRKTHRAIKDAQVDVAVYVDGKAGVITQRALALAILGDHPSAGSLAPGLAQGQMQHESSFLLGNYSSARSLMNFDAGVCQLNSQQHALRDAFNPVHSIGLLVARTRDAYSRYSNRSIYRGDDHTELRRWKLAAGAWNAPAFANWLAGVGDAAEPGPTARAALENYMNSVTSYLENNQ